MSNETKFTAGPWAAGDYDDRFGETEIHAGNHKICTVEFIDNEDDANLDLMAVAPEMYAMIESLASELNSMIEAENARLKGMASCTDLDMPDYIDQESIHDAQVLLAKARGNNNEQ